MATINSLPKYPKNSCKICKNNTCSYCLSDQNNYGTNAKICGNKSQNIRFNNTSGPLLFNKNYQKNINCETGMKTVHDFFQKTKNGPYYSFDPRIRSPATNQEMSLDRPPQTSKVWLQNVYNNSLVKYGQNYDSYSDINTGQIQYYTSKDLSNPLIHPVFTIQSNVEQDMFIDPMGSSSPQYLRTPKTKNNRNVSDYQYMRDSLEHREDIISKQMDSGRYRTDWAMRYNQFK